MQQHRPKVEAGRVVVDLENSTQEELATNEALLGYLRQRTGQPSLTITPRVADNGPNAPIPYTDKQKCAKLLSDMPELQGFFDGLGLVPEG